MAISSSALLYQIIQKNLREIYYELNTILSVLFGAIIAVGALFFLYQLYNIVVIDARSRGIKHPHFGGFLTLGNTSGGGLLLYLIRRRNCPVVNITESDTLEIAKKLQQVSGFHLFV